MNENMTLPWGEGGRGGKEREEERGGRYKGGGKGRNEGKGRNFTLGKERVKGGSGKEREGREGKRGGNGRRERGEGVNKHVRLMFCWKLPKWNVEC